MSSINVRSVGDGVGLLEIDRPERRNALDDEMLQYTLPEAIARLRDDETIRAAVIAGTGGAFCAGADLESEAMGLPTPAASEAFLRKSHRTPVSLRELGKPSVAAINGPAVGAGLGMALACDFRIASAQSIFSTPFIRMGLPPDFGTSYFLPRAVGPAMALDMFLAGRVLDADEAFRIGLISRVSSDPLSDALDMALVLAANPPSATRATLRNVYRGLDLDMRSAILDDEIRAVTIALHGHEFQAALATWKAQILGRSQPQIGGIGQPDDIEGRDSA